MADYSEMWVGTSLRTVVRQSDKVGIPPDVRNMDYVAYLAWVDAAGSPEFYALDLATMTVTKVDQRPGELPRGE